MQHIPRLPGVSGGMACCCRRSSPSASRLRGASDAETLLKDLYRPAPLRRLADKCDAVQGSAPAPEPAAHANGAAAPDPSRNPGIPGPCEALAEAALAEALACPAGPAARPYATALVQLAASLPVGPECQARRA